MTKQKSSVNTDGGKMKPLSTRKFWQSIMQINRKDINFRVEYSKWLWNKPKSKQRIVNLYCRGYPQLEIVGLLLKGPKKIRQVLKEMRASLEWNIKKHGWLDE